MAIKTLRKFWKGVTSNPLYALGALGIGSSLYGALGLVIMLQACDILCGDCCFSPLLVTSATAFLLAMSFLCIQKEPDRSPLPLRVKASVCA